MNLAVISLAALAVAVTLSCTTQINVGIVGMVMAWIIGVYLAGMSPNDIAAGFPIQLFLTLVGVTLLFSGAKANGTLDKIANRAVQSCRGNLALIPMMFAGLAFIFGSIGPGSTAAAAIIGPMAMAVAGQTGISPFLMAIIVANGANASSLSPIAPTGIIVNGLMTRIGILDVQWQNYANVMVAHMSVGFAGYFVFGGWRYFGKTYTAELTGTIPDAMLPFERRHWLTLAVILLVIAGVVIFNLNVGWAALAGVVVLVLLGAADEAVAIRTMPWGPILMVSGVTVLIALVEKTGGMDLFSTLLAKLSTANSVTAVTAFITGTISVYSSTSGVVLPAFLPTVPGLMAKLGTGNAMAIASSMIVGAHLVDVSPLSTTGALFIAAAPANTDTRQLFRWMLAWGLSMAVVAAVGCFIVFGVFRLWQ